MPHPLKILVGPTASGKTALALGWARATGGWILSCDALLFYRGADIGTAKPTPAERREVPHFGIDLSEPAVPYNLSRYVNYALETLEKAEARNVPVLAVGGSGFYAAAFHDPPPDPIQISREVRARVQEIEEEGGIEGLRNALLALDPEPEVDLLNPRRLAPALERCLATGLSTRELRARQRALPCPFGKWERRWFRVEPSGPEIVSRITTRTEQMLENGLIEEVRSLDAMGLRNNPTLASAIGYRETLAALDGEKDLGDLLQEITLHTVQLAKRQKRWIRNRLPETQPITDAVELVG